MLNVEHFIVDEKLRSKGVKSFNARQSVEGKHISGGVKDLFQSDKFVVI